MWELGERAVPYTLITDSMAASLMASKQVDAVWVGAIDPDVVNPALLMSVDDYPQRGADARRCQPAGVTDTGGLATAGVGTALGVIIHAHQQGRVNNVWVDETWVLPARCLRWQSPRTAVYLLRPVARLPRPAR
jgi:hypothetical protein